VSARTGTMSMPCPSQYRYHGHAQHATSGQGILNEGKACSECILVLQRTGVHVRSPDLHWNHLMMLCCPGGTCRRGMLPTEMSGMFWLRSQIREVVDSVWRAATDVVPPCSPLPPSSSTGDGSCGLLAVAYSPVAGGCPAATARQADGTARGPFKPEIILANQLAYGQVGCSSGSISKIELRWCRSMSSMTAKTT
jgi:hypothetical protein